ncbi:MAG TPA: polymer-forming cytoskeletal protein [Acetobacteraceae bacterium]|nr:polymer-forming cytoskeletal protein [Acetobacteraceae bacterium]
MFKRRKPDEMPAGSGGTLPAGLSATDSPSRFAEEAGKTDLHPRTPGAASGPADSGLGVPPFRPAQPKEAQSMSRPPFPATPGSPSAAPGQPARPAAAPSRTANRDPGERRTLVVGRGISVQGTVQDAERLVVEGTVEASMIHATELAIAPGGVFKGEVEVEDAEIAGTIDGTLTARGSLVVRATGRVLGTARCRRLQVEDGGQITGRIEMLGDQVRTEAPRLAAEPAD